MPIVNVKLVENVFDGDQKQRLIAKLTDAVEAVHPGLRDVTFVTIDEVKEGDWGIGGQPITTEKVTAHAEDNVSS